MLKERRRRTDSLCVGETTSILSTKKKPIFQCHNQTLSRKGSLTTCITKHTPEEKARIAPKPRKPQLEDNSEFQPSFTFQRVDLCCMEDKIEVSPPDLTHSDTVSLEAPEEGQFSLLSPEFPRMADSPGQHVPSSGYLPMFKERAGRITLQMRAVLINWISEITELFMFKREAFYMTVNILDRYLEARSLEVDKEKFQLVGMSCLYIASKFEVGRSLLSRSLNTNMWTIS